MAAPAPEFTPTTSWQRDRHSTVSPFLVSSGAQRVIDFVTEVLGAEVLMVAPTEDKKGVLHAGLRVGDSVIMIMDANEEFVAVPARIHVFVPDVDKTYELAVSKGAETVVAPRDEYYGDRSCSVKDSTGNTWWIATQKFIVKYCPV